jgi:archaeal preflagellin peptidase FlaK
VDEASIAVRYLLGVAMLAGAIPSDLRTRRVANTWWLPFLAAAVILVAGDLLDGSLRPTDLAFAYVPAVLLSLLLYGFWRLRLFGGADAKALMVLAFLCPWASPGPEAALVPALDALANGALLVLVLPLANLLLNLAQGHLRFPAAILGRQVPLQAARARHVWPMQAVVDGNVQWRYWQRAGLADQDTEYDALQRAGLQNVWVTAKVPFLVPLAAGLALSWWCGNVPALLAARLVGS